MPRLRMVQLVAQRAAIKIGNTPALWGETFWSPHMPNEAGDL